MHQFALSKGNSFISNIFVERVLGLFEGVAVQADQLRIVVQHLFKVWHMPFGIYRISRKTTTHLIIQTAIAPHYIWVM